MLLRQQFITPANLFCSMSNDIDIRTLRIFIEAARLGSFSAAARRHGLPVSSVSRHIAALEQRIGQQLFVRHTRAIKLTEAGATYHAELREALAAMDLATERASGSEAEPRGVLRINAPVAFGRRHIAPALAEYHALYRHVDVDLTLTDTLIDPVTEGADILVRIGAAEDATLVARRLGAQNQVLCATEGYVARHGGIVAELGVEA